MDSTSLAMAAKPSRDIACESVVPGLRGDCLGVDFVLPQEGLGKKEGAAGKADMRSEQAAIATQCKVSRGAGALDVEEGDLSTADWDEVRGAKRG